MKIIVFRLSEDGYSGYNLLDDKADILIQFFLSDVGSRGAVFKDFFNNSDEETFSCNYSFLIKHGDDVLISCLFDEDPYEYGIEMSQKELVSMLDLWDQFLKQRPQEIIVYKEGESYRLEGHGFPDKKE